MLYVMREFERKSVEGIMSVFHVKHCPGRIFVEARAPARAFDMLKNAHGVSQHVFYTVPFAEKVGVLSPVLRQSSLAPGQFVRVRSSIYRGDIALLDVVNEKEQFVYIRLVPRLPPPVLDVRPTKRARVQHKRYPRLRTSLSKVQATYAQDVITQVDSSPVYGTCYEFQGKPYSTDFFRIKKHSLSLVSDTTPKLSDISHFIDAAVEKLVSTHQQCATDVEDPDRRFRYTDGDVLKVGGFDLSKVSIEEVLKVSYPVNILEEGTARTSGTIAQLTTNGTAVVAIDKTTPTVYLEVSITKLRIKFKPGDSVLAKFGAFAGKIGLVEKADTFMVIARETITNEEVSEYMRVESYLHDLHRCMYALHSQNRSLKMRLHIGIQQ